MPTIYLPTALLRAALPAASTEETRYYLNGVFLDRDGASGALVSTDGNILFAATVDLANLTASIIIPLDTLKKALAGHKLEESILEYDGAVYLLNGIRFSPIDGTFPDWRRVCPATVDGAPAIFDPAIMANMAKIAKALGVPCSAVSTHLNGNGPAIVTFGNRVDCFDCFGLVMPRRMSTTASEAESRVGLVTGRKAVD